MKKEKEQLILESSTSLAITFQLFNKIDKIIMTRIYPTTPILISYLSLLSYAAELSASLRYG
jgi:hypothetical protein